MSANVISLTERWFWTFEDSRDAEEAQYRMDRQRLFGKEIEVEFARGERKSLFIYFE